MSNSRHAPGVVRLYSRIRLDLRAGRDLPDGDGRAGAVGDLVAEAGGAAEPVGDPAAGAVVGVGVPPAAQRVRAGGGGDVAVLVDLPPLPLVAAAGEVDPPRVDVAAAVEHPAFADEDLVAVGAADGVAERVVVGGVRAVEAAPVVAGAGLPGAVAPLPGPAVAARVVPGPVPPAGVVGGAGLDPLDAARRAGPVVGAADDDAVRVLAHPDAGAFVGGAAAGEAAVGGAGRGRAVELLDRAVGVAGPGDGVLLAAELIPVAVLLSDDEPVLPDPAVGVRADVDAAPGEPAVALAPRDAVGVADRGRWEVDGVVADLEGVAVVSLALERTKRPVLVKSYALSFMPTNRKPWACTLPCGSRRRHS